MAVIQIPNLPAAANLSGAELLEAVQAGTSVKVTAAQIALLVSPFSGSPLGVPFGGTGLSSGISGGVPYFSSTTTMASSALLANNAIMLGGGVAGAPKTTTTGTGVVTALGVNVGSAGAFVVNGGALGTPSSGTLTNCTGYPVASLTGLGANVATFLATPTSANLAAAVTDETGSGSLVFATGPSLSSPTIATPSITGNITISGNILATGTNARFIGDFTNATVNSRFAFQTSSLNSATGIYALPSGIGSAASWQAANASDPTNASKILIATNGNTDVQLVSGINGAGTYLPLTIFTSGARTAQFSTTVGTFTLGVAGAAQGILGLTGATSGTVSVQGAAAAGTWTLTLPATGGTNNYVLTTNGSGTTSWSQVSLTAGVTGVLPVANGGTNASTASITSFNNITGYTAAGATGTTSTNLVFSTSPTVSYLLLAAGTATASQAPLKFTSGTNLATAEAGATEYNGSFLYFTPGTTSGRGFVPSVYDFRLTANGGAIGATIADFFGATSSISLEATSVYDIEIYAYFTKTTAGTATWTLTCSSAPTLLTGYYTACPITGIAAGAVTSGYAGSQAATTAAFAATGSLSTGVNHWFQFKVQIVTNAATNFRLQLTQSAGTATPLAGSYYSVTRVSTSTGAFVA